MNPFKAPLPPCPPALSTHHGAGWLWPCCHRQPPAAQLEGWFRSIASGLPPTSLAKALFEVCHTQHARPSRDAAQSAAARCEPIPPAPAVPPELLRSGCASAWPRHLGPCRHNRPATPHSPSPPSNYLLAPWPANLPALCRRARPPRASSDRPQSARPAPCGGNHSASTAPPESGLPYTGAFLCTNLSG